MRALILMILAFGSLSAALPPQAMDYRFQKTPLEQVLAQINARQDINLVYSPSILLAQNDTPRAVTMDVRRVTPQQALAAVLASHGLIAKELPGSILVITDPLDELVSGPHGSVIPLSFWNEVEPDPKKPMGWFKNTGAPRLGQRMEYGDLTVPPPVFEDLHLAREAMAREAAKVDEGLQAAIDRADQEADAP